MCSRVALITVMLLSCPAFAQDPVTAEDYARAEGFLSSGTSSLVTGEVSSVTRLPDGRIRYRRSTGQGQEFVVFEPGKAGERKVVAAPPGPAPSIPNAVLTT